MVPSRSAPGWAAHLDGLSMHDSVTDRAALAKLPVLRKSDLQAKQKADPPFGGFLAGKSSQRPHACSCRRGRSGNRRRPVLTRGTVRGRCTLRASASGVYGPQCLLLSPDAWAGSSSTRAAIALGCTVFPAGVGNTDMQVEAIEVLRPTAFVGNAGLPEGSPRPRCRAGPGHVLHQGCAGLRRRSFPVPARGIRASKGISVAQCYATADLGVIAYETEAREGMVVNEDYIVEIVRPGTGEPVADGEGG
jgi:phenylacetate-CoA ligase